MSHAAKAFDASKVSGEQARLQSENQRLKAMVGELTMALKKPSSGYEARLSKRWLSGSMSTIIIIYIQR